MDEIVEDDVSCEVDGLHVEKNIVNGLLVHSIYIVVYDMMITSIFTIFT
jgi:hypothetical protein